MGLHLPARGRVAALALALAGTVLVAAPAHAEQTDITVITHNIKGGQDNKGNLAALDAVTNQTNTHDPDVVMLQEVCASQYAEFVRRFPVSAGWTTTFTIRKHHTGCGENIGEVIATQRNGATVLPPVPLSSENPDIGYHLTCVAFVKNGGRPYRACTTHLSATDKNAAVREAQLNEIKPALQSAIDAGNGVIFGGDLNTLPGHPTMNKLYKIRNNGTQTGGGSFFEGDQDDAQHYGSACAEERPFCKSGEATKTGEKVDYIFFSAAHTRASGPNLSEVIAGKGLSNHKIVRATSRFYW